MTVEWQRIEGCIQRYLKDWWGQEFTKQKLQLKADEGSIEIELDAVSEDGKIIAEIKNMKHPEHPREMELVQDDIHRLMAIKADRKLLFLTDQLFYMAFCRKYKDKLLDWRRSGIDIMSPFELEKYLQV